MHVTANSKEVKPGSIFFALQGAKFDGHAFISDAIAKGASLVYAEREVGIKSVIVLGSQARKKLAELASEMYGHPTRSLKMIGITGTSGKTTTTYLTQYLIDSAGIPCARLGTNGGHFRGRDSETANTTPDALSLQKWFREVADLGAQAIVMEVSSHALDQDRAWGIAWDEMCFLNLSPEHMDYHPTLDHYFETKSKLFKEHASYAVSLQKIPKLFSNVGNAFGFRLKTLVKDVNAFSIQTDVRNLKNVPNGIEFEVMLKQKWFAAMCPLFGAFQSENILAALELVLGLGITPEVALENLKKFPGVPGRMEQVPNARGVYIFVDYAHKPEALEKVLTALTLSPEEKAKGRRILTVFGCGGDRDKTKRPVMGEIATRLSDFVYLTSDNPRTENAETILKEIESGIKTDNFSTISDRAIAIRTAITDAKPHDFVLIAGKGHENYQIIGSEKKHFDDREEALKTDILRS
jgi:UDP-N-acetylmuramoyl-L-alanyl-D-glutamate--2,6-diaminopimelate ligase